jgi:hypothetical protein
MLIPIIEQIALANESAGGGSIVLLTQCAKLELEATINAAEINLRGSGLWRVLITRCWLTPLVCALL